MNTTSEFVSQVEYVAGEMNSLLNGVARVGIARMEDGHVVLNYALTKDEDGACESCTMDRESARDLFEEMLVARMASVGGKYEKSISVEMEQA